jgi:DNA-binding transcriptional regulator LsrR (DeoR family)
LSDRHCFFCINLTKTGVFRNAEIIFAGVRAFKEGPSVLTSHAKVGIKKTDLVNSGVVGDMNFAYFDETGRDLTRAAFASLLSAEGNTAKASSDQEVLDRHPFLPAVSLHWFKRQSKAPDKFVCMVAGGSHKFKAIKAAIRGGLANGLITDDKTAQSLLIP